MRRIWAILGVLGGIAVIVGAFLPFVTKEGGNIATADGNIPSTLGGMDDWVGWVLLGAGVLILLLALVMLRARSRIVAVLLLLTGVVAAGAGVWALVDPTNVYVQVGALQAGEDADSISSIVEQFDQDVTAESGAWLAAIGGALAVLAGFALVVIPKRRSEEAEAPAEAPTTAELEERSEPEALVAPAEEAIPPPPEPAPPTEHEPAAAAEEPPTASEPEIPAGAEEPPVESEPEIPEAPEMPSEPDAEPREVAPQPSEPEAEVLEAAEAASEVEEASAAPEEPETQDSPESPPPEPPDVRDWR